MSMGSRVRKTAAAGAAAFVLAGTTVLTTSGSAVAAPAPIVVGSCGVTVQGQPGQPIALDPSGLLGQSPGSLPVVSLGMVGNESRSIGLPVTEIANQLGGAASKLPILGGITNALTKAIGSGCTVFAKTVNTASAPVQKSLGGAAKPLGDAASQGWNTLAGPPQSGGPQPAPEQPGGPGAPGSQPGGGSDRPAMPRPDSKVGSGLDPASLQGFAASFGRSPMLDYSSLPFANPGLFAPSPGVRYGGQVPGYAPEFGILGEDGKKGQGGQGNVQNAGKAEALDAPKTNDVALPVLLGVFALTGLIAALVRTWVLRRSAP